MYIIGACCNYNSNIGLFMDSIPRAYIYFKTILICDVIIIVTGHTHRTISRQRDEKVKTNLIGINRLASVVLYRKSNLLFKDSPMPRSGQLKAVNLIRS